MGIEVNNDILIVALVPDIINEVIDKIVEEHKKYEDVNVGYGYYGMIHNLEKYKQACQFRIITKNESFNEYLESLSSKYDNKLWIKNVINIINSNNSVVTIISN